MQPRDIDVGFGTCTRDVVVLIREITRAPVVHRLLTCLGMRGLVPSICPIAILALACTSSENRYAQSYSAISYAQGRFVAVGGSKANIDAYGPSDGRIAVSSDGEVWSATELLGSGRFSAVAHGDGRWVATVADYFSTERGVESLGGVWIADDNATNWRPIAAPPAEELTGLAFGNGVFVAGANADQRMQDSPVFTSVDGETWTRISMPPLWWDNRVAFVDGKFFVTGDGSGIAESTDGTNWTFTDTRLLGIGPVIRYNDATFAYAFDDVGATDGPSVPLAFVLERQAPAWPATQVGDDVSVQLASVRADVASVGDALVGAHRNGIVRLTGDRATGTWSVVLPGPGVGPLATDGAGTVAAGVAVGFSDDADFAVSHDRGLSWQRVTSGLP